MVKNLSKKGITGKERTAKNQKETMSWACHLTPWSSYAWYSRPFMFQETVNTPFCFKVACVGFFGFYSRVPTGTHNLNTKGFSAAYLGVLTRKLESRANELALSYFLATLINMPLSSKPAPPPASLPLLLGSASSQKPQPKPLNPSSPQCLSPNFPPTTHTFKIGSRGGTRFDQLPCSCLKT